MSGKIPLERVGEFMKAIFKELKAAGGEARLRDLFGPAGAALHLSAYEKALYEKSGYVRWQSIVHFYSIGCVKAGFIVKEGGKWHLTPEGEAALSLPPLQFVQRLKEAYSTWKKSQPAEADADGAANERLEEVAEQHTAFDQANDRAWEEILEHVNEMNPYDFQKLVEELLIAMGYHVPFNAPPGPDGGVDLIAYHDPFGTQPPRLKVQVKHKEAKATVKELRELQGILKKEGDAGMLVSSGGFTADAVKEARSGSGMHIELMDLNRLITLWQENYDKLRESGKKRLPLVRVFFLAPPEE